MYFLKVSGLATLANSYVTLTCGIYLLHAYARWGRKNYFHLFWALGFLFYGIEIFTGLWLPLTHIFKAFLFIASLTLWFVGIGFLLPKLKTAFIFTANIMFLSFLVIVLSFRDYSLIIALIPFFLVTLGIILLIKNYGKFLYSLFLGWVFLSAINLLFLLRLLPSFHTDLLAILAKIIILYGAVNPMFAMVGTEMQRMLWRTGRALPVKQSHFTLIRCVKTSHLREVSWIKQKVVDNSKRGIKTFLLILYDLISLPELEELELLNCRDIHVVRILRETERERLREEYSVNVFDEGKFSVIKDDLTSLGFLISRIVRYSQERKVGCNVIVYSLSWLIHTHGWRNVYLLLTYKMPEIKNSQVYLHAFYYPETHEERVTLATFEKLAEEIITI